MSKKEKAALALEHKILLAIERGEFTPDIGYLGEFTLIGPCPASVCPIGPCGCMLGAAASVLGLKGHASQDELIDYLGEQGVDRRDALLLESGYEDVRDMYFMDGTEEFNPYYQVGKRLRRFHPNRD